MKIRILILCILFILHLQPIRSAEAPDYRFRVEVLTQSIPKPMELEIAPDGRIFYNDIYGSLNIYHPESGKIELAGKLPVFTDQENGFLGFALDPDFSSNHWIYLFYSPIEFSGQHLSRFEMDGDRLDFDTEKVILKFEDQRERCCHHAGSVEFGPNGNLFISTGDNTDPGADTAGYAPIDERPGKHPVDAQKSSANTHDLRGKILRIRPLSDGTYQIPNGNLFPEDGSSGRPEIFVMGCRNPWRMSVDDKTGIVYWGEVGPDAGTTSARGSRGYDEINQARTAGNYGWPYFVGNNFAYADYDFATKEIGPLYDPQRPINESPNNTGNRILPPAQAALIYWPYADSPEFPSLGSGGRTACAGPVFHYRPEFAESNGFPQHFDNCLLFWDWQRPFMKWARLDSNSKLESIEDFTHAVVLSNDSGQSSSGGKSNRFLIQRPVDALFGPDGCLYMLDYGKTWGSNQDSQLIKISYIRGNLPPVAIASASQSFGREPLAVHFTSTGSLDYESDSVSYEWSLHPGGKTFSTSPNADMKIDQPGNYVVSLKVSDQEGLSSTVQVPVTVGNSRPKVVFKSPKEGDFFEPGKPISYQVLVEDFEDGNSFQNDELMDARTLVTARFQKDLNEKEIVHPVLGMMQSSDCFNCHAVQQKIVGPPFMEIAERYRGQAGAVEQSVQRVIKGSTGIWGEVPMLPHTQHSVQQVEQMLRWIYELKPGKTDQWTSRGLNEILEVPISPKNRIAIIEATYTDFGRGPVASLTGSTTIRLRHRTIEGEHCDEYSGLSIMGSKLGSIKHGASAVFRNLNLSNSSSITVRVASGGPGCTLEFHSGSKEGKQIAELEVPNTGGYDRFVFRHASIAPIPERGDVVIVFNNPGKGGLMDLDWIRFDP